MGSMGWAVIEGTVAAGVDIRTPPPPFFSLFLVSYHVKRKGRAFGVQGNRWLVGNLLESAKRS